MPKRLFDIFFSLTGLILLMPFLLIVALLVKITSPGPVFYAGFRIGQNERMFRCLKFRSMKVNNDDFAITVGERDPRITTFGIIIRKLKIDELPQLWNVLVGNMTFVGPRPDTSKYRHYYKAAYPDYYKHKPGITSPSSLYFIDECEIYVGKSDPEKIYIEETIPKKVELDMEYFRHVSVLTDIKYILITIYKIFRR